MLSRVEAPAALTNFAGSFAASSIAAAGASAPPPCASMPVASYQALLANLGLEPDPRLCVPAVHR